MKAEGSLPAPNLEQPAAQAFSDGMKQIEAQGGLGEHRNRYGGDVSQCPFLSRLGEAGLKFIEQLESTPKSKLSLAEMLDDKPEPAEPASSSSRDVSVNEPKEPKTSIAPAAPSAKLERPIFEPAEPKLEPPKAAVELTAPEVVLSIDTPVELPKPFAIQQKAKPEQLEPLIKERSTEAIEVTEQPNLVDEPAPKARPEATNTEPTSASLAEAAPTFATRLIEYIPALLKENKPAKMPERFTPDEQPAPEASESWKPVAETEYRPAEPQSAKVYEPAPSYLSEQIEPIELTPEPKQQTNEFEQLVQEWLESPIPSKLEQPKTTELLNEIAENVAEILATKTTEPPSESQELFAANHEAPKNSEELTIDLQQLCEELFTQIGIVPTEEMIKKVAADIVQAAKERQAEAINNQPQDQGTHEIKFAAIKIKQHLLATVSEQVQRLIELGRLMVRSATAA